ncbi:MAG: trypsin-like serine protease [Gemmataceae bacterium]|nr:trypsin-like serine protease [Gemmataceae bacterium]
MRHTGLMGLVALAMAIPAAAADIDPLLKKTEDRRVEVIRKVYPAVAAVVTGGGSGVVISPDGYALTNFHVVAGQPPTLKCGLADGVLYDAVLVGLDKIGDVALIKLLPKVEGKLFPFAPLGDSDKVRTGDYALAMGNPFMLATDFTPTVSFGVVSGVRRYQYPERGMFEYTDCIQIDTSINPGNSGGPLFNMNGELIGINGRGSFDKRARINSGVGYAISINQIKNFMGHLRAGLFVDHASLGALVSSGVEETAQGRVSVTAMIESDASRRGLKVDDQLLYFGPRPMTSVNQFKNVLGLFPKGWRVPLTFKRELDNGVTERKEILVRLMGYERLDLNNPNAAPVEPKPQPERPMPGGPGRPTPGPAPEKKGPTGPGAKLFEAKAGYANYYFNKLERDKLLAAFKKSGDFTSLKGAWQMQATGKLGDKGRQAVVVLRAVPKGAKDANNDLLQGIFDGIDFSVEPLAVEVSGQALRDPPGSGGLLVAFFQLRQLLVYGEKGFVGNFSHGGVEPYYPPPTEGTKPDYLALRVDAQILRTSLGGVNTKWFFHLNGQLLGLEVTLDRDEDPCEVHFSEYRKDASGRELPGRLIVKYGDRDYAALRVDGWKLDDK